MKRLLTTGVLALLAYVLGAQVIASDQTIVQNNFTISDVDISGTGTLIGSGDDAAFPFTLPFTFQVPGGANTDMLVAVTNGYISDDLSSSGGDLSNDCPLPELPSTNGGARMYVLHDDLISDVYTEALPVAHPSIGGLQSYVVFFDNVTHFGGTDTWQMAIIFWSNGDFAYVYGAGNTEDGAGSTVGVQNLAADMGNDLGIACDTPGQGFGTTLTSISVLSPAEDIPTLGEWGCILLFLVLSLFGIVSLQEKKLTAIGAER